MEEAQPGDVILVAHMYEPELITSQIQEATNSWYSHALVALGNGTYAHATPSNGSAIEIFESELELRESIVPGDLFDLFRPTTRPNERDLVEAARHLARKAIRTPDVEGDPGDPVLVFSDGNLIGLYLARKLQQNPRSAQGKGQRWLRAAIAAAAESEGRLFCSSYVFQVLAHGGVHLDPPPPGQRFLDLTGFEVTRPAEITYTSELAAEILDEEIRDEEVTQNIWTRFTNVAGVAFAFVDITSRIFVHFHRDTDPETLNNADFLTPSDLSLSPSLELVASRYRLPNGGDSGWVAQLPLPAFGDYPFKE